MARSPALPCAWIADPAGHARLIVPLFVDCEIEGAELHLLTQPFLKRDIQVSSLSNPTSTVTLAAAFPNFRHSHIIFNIDRTTLEVDLSISWFSYCPAERVKPHQRRLRKDNKTLIVFAGLASLVQKTGRSTFCEWRYYNNSPFRSSLSFYAGVSNNTSNF